MKQELKSIALRGVLIIGALMLPLPGAGGLLSWHYDRAMAQSSPEKDAFEAAKELGTVEAWDAFLSSYPTGFHADLARAYVKKLAAPSAAPPVAAPAVAAPPTTAPALAAPPLPAQELACTEAANLKSERSNEPVKIRFVNESESTIVLQWIDYDGALKEYGELQPGAVRVQDTFITHPWIAAYQEGSCRQLFLPVDGVSLARLLPEEQVRKPSAAAAPRTTTKRESDGDDHGPTPEQTCKNIGQDYNGRECVPRTAAKPSKATITRRERAACLDIGMAYINGKCAPKTKAERKKAAKNKNKACPAGMYRNPYGQCQPNETGG